MNIDIKNIKEFLMDRNPFSYLSLGKKLRNNNTEQNIILFSIIAFSLLRLPYFLSDAFLPDELWHTGYMQSLMLNNIFNIPNYQGHGSGFWIFGKIIYLIYYQLLGNAYYFLPTMKVLSLLSLILSVYYMNKIGVITKSKNRALIILCFLTTPLLWWGGKLIFPEFHSVFLLIFSLYYILKSEHKTNLKLPWILMGFATGMKLTALPVVVFIYLISLFFKKIIINFNKTLFYYSSNASIWFIIGFIICNPFLVWTPQMFFDELLLNGAYQSQFSIKALMGHYGNIISNNSASWDIIYFGGINEAAIPVISFCLAFIYILLNTSKNWKIILSTVLSYIAFIMMITFNQKAVSYYFFQSTVIIFLAMCFIESNKNIRFKISQILCLLIIITNLFTVIPTVSRDNNIRFHQETLLENWKENTTCVKNVLADLKPVNLIINNSGPGGNHRRNEMIDFQHIASQLSWVKDGFNTQTLSIIAGNHNDFHYSIVNNYLNKEASNLSARNSAAKRIIIIEGKWTYNVLEYIDYNEKFFKYLKQHIPNNKITKTLLASCGENDIWMISL